MQRGHVGNEHVVMNQFERFWANCCLVNMLPLLPAVPNDKGLLLLLLLLLL
jgi:hypothetical protein